MLAWMKRLGSTAHHGATADATTRKRRGAGNAGRYQLLYEYLENRHAQAVVLTFGQIEDLLGFTLPVLARSDQDWWVAADTGTGEARFSDAWTLASRTARANLKAQTVVFERLP